MSNAQIIIIENTEQLLVYGLVYIILRDGMVKVVLDYKVCRETQRSYFHLILGPESSSTPSSWALSVIAPLLPANGFPV